MVTHVQKKIDSDFFCSKQSNIYATLTSAIHGIVTTVATPNMVLTTPCCTVSSPCCFLYRKHSTRAGHGQLQKRYWFRLVVWRWLWWSILCFSCLWMWGTPPFLLPTALLCRLILLENTRDYWILLEITRDYWRLLGITGDYWRLLEITRDYWRLLEITRDYWRLL